MRVLIVDNDSSSRSRVRHALVQRLSAEVTECGDGGAALEALSRGTYSLLVTELQLPMMSGIEMLTIVRHQPRLRGLPVIVLTTKGDDALVRRVIGLGVGDYLIKPVNTDRLCDRARALANELAASQPDATALAGATRSRRQLPRAGRILLPPLRDDAATATSLSAP
jgi:two-component system, chemotaxis family, chemotaxis protein CheY